MLALKTTPHSMTVSSYATSGFDSAATTGISMQFDITSSPLNSGADY